MTTSVDPSKRNFILNPAHLKIRVKIVGLMLLVEIVTITAAMGFSFYQLSQRNTQAVGNSLKSYGQEAVQRAAETVERQVVALQALALSPSLKAAVTTANQAYAGQDPARLKAQIAEWDQAWMDDAASIQDRVSAATNNPVSADLKAFALGDVAVNEKCAFHRPHFVEFGNAVGNQVDQPV